MDVAGQAVELGNDEHGAALPAFGKGGGELGPLRVVPVALHFDKFPGELPACGALSNDRLNNDTTEAIRNCCHLIVVLGSLSSPYQS
jgi:hypothetical protein